MECGYKIQIFNAKQMFIERKQFIYECEDFSQPKR